MTELIVVHLVAGAILGGLALNSLLNHLALPRLTRMPMPARLPRISVLIPARNEAARIGPAVRGWATQDYPRYEVVVYDDDSTDETAAGALAAAGGVPHVRVIRGRGLPAGWRGKPWACHRLRAHAQGEILLFTDADVVPAAHALTRTAGALAALESDAISAVPSHESPSTTVRALAALQNWAMLALVPSWLDAARRHPWFAAMTGQFIVIRAEVYDAVGGFAADRRSLAEDVALARRLVASGRRVRALDGAGVLRCHPYATARELWRANVRNLLPIFFDSAGALLGGVLVFGAVQLAPFVVLAVSLARGGGPTWLGTWLPIGEIALALGSRALSDWRAGYPWWMALTQPLAALALIGMGVHSVVRHRLRRAVEWRQRDYEIGGGSDRPLQTSPLTRGATTVPLQTSPFARGATAVPSKRPRPRGV